jgi:hypothetical protein
MRKLMLMFLCAMAGPLWAVIMIPQSVESLTTQAQAIVQGTVVSRSCQRDDAGRIYTSIEFAVAEVWKGAVATNRITLVHGGGVLGEEKAVVSGQVDYPVGEEAVVFLVWNPCGQGVTLGLCQGKFKITKDPTTGERLADNGMVARTVPSTNVPARTLTAPTSRAAWSLADLKQRVREAQP